MTHSKTGSECDLNAIDSINTLKIELDIRSKNASSGRDGTSVTATSEREEHLGITAPLENVSKMNNTLGVLNIKDETRNKIHDQSSELSVPGTQLDQQPQVHHRNAKFLAKEGSF